MLKLNNFSITKLDRDSLSLSTINDTVTLKNSVSESTKKGYSMHKTGIIELAKPNKCMKLDKVFCQGFVSGGYRQMLIRSLAKELFSNPEALASVFGDGFLLTKTCAEFIKALIDRKKSVMWAFLTKGDLTTSEDIKMALSISFGAAIDSSASTDVQKLALKIARDIITLQLHSANLLFLDDSYDFVSSFNKLGSAISTEKLDELADNLYHIELQKNITEAFIEIGFVNDLLALRDSLIQNAQISKDNKIGFEVFEREKRAKIDELARKMADAFKSINRAVNNVLYSPARMKNVIALLHLHLHFDVYKLTTSEQGMVIVTNYQALSSKTLNNLSYLAEILEFFNMQNSMDETVIWDSWSEMLGSEQGPSVLLEKDVDALIDSLNSEYSYIKINDILTETNHLEVSINKKDGILRAVSLESKFEVSGLRDATDAQAIGLSTIPAIDVPTIASSMAVAGAPRAGMAIQLQKPSRFNAHKQYQGNLIKLNTFSRTMFLEALDLYGSDIRDSILLTTIGVERVDIERLIMTIEDATIIRDLRADKSMLLSKWCLAIKDVKDPSSYTSLSMLIKNVKERLGHNVNSQIDKEWLTINDNMLFPLDVRALVLIKESRKAVGAVSLLTRQLPVDKNLVIDGALIDEFTSEYQILPHNIETDIHIDFAFTGSRGFNITWKMCDVFDESDYIKKSQIVPFFNYSDEVETRTNLYLALYYLIILDTLSGATFGEEKIFDSEELKTIYSTAKPYILDFEYQFDSSFDFKAFNIKKFIEQMLSLSHNFRDISKLKNRVLIINTDGTLKLRASSTPTYRLNIPFTTLDMSKKMLLDEKASFIKNAQSLMLRHNPDVLALELSLLLENDDKVKDSIAAYRDTTKAGDLDTAITRNLILQDKTGFNKLIKDKTILGLHVLATSMVAKKRSDMLIRLATEGLSKLIAEEIDANPLYRLLIANSSTSYIETLYKSYSLTQGDLKLSRNFNQFVDIVDKQAIEIPSVVLEAFVKGFRENAAAIRSFSVNSDNPRVQEIMKKQEGKLASIASSSTGKKEALNEL